jgi:biotin carboxyl carrier protein
VIKKYRIKLNEKVYEVEVEEAEIGSDNVNRNAQSEKQEEVAVTSSATSEKILAPLPGNILDVRVKEGDSVKTGQVLLILEAMKLENEIVAPRDGIIDRIIGIKGGIVVTGDTLIAIK